MTTREQVERLIQRCWEEPYGVTQIALADEAIRHADALGDVPLRFEARLAATEAYQMGGEPAKTFVTFSWCLTEYDRSPGRYGAREDSLLRWYFKCVAGSLCRFPEVPLERTNAVLDDMERRYRLGGHSMHAVYQHRWLVAHHIGDTARAEEWYERWTTAPRDENSDCAGCDPTDRVEHLATVGRDADAVTLAQPVLGGQLTCAEQPQAILTSLLLPYLRTGRLDDARDAHLRAYRSHRHQRADLSSIADHVLFCAVTGNEARGLELVDRHLDWLERAPSPFAELEFASAAATALGRPAVRGLQFRDGTAGELADRLAERARALAARFDARNGTAHQSARIEARLAMSPLVDSLPLTAVARAASRVGPNRPANAGPFAAGSAGTGPSAAAPAPPNGGQPSAAPADQTPPADPTALLDLISVEQRQGPGGRVTELLTVLDERHPDLPPVLAARRSEERGRWHANAGRMVEAEPEFAAAAAAFDALGDQARHQVALARLGLVMCATDRADEGLLLVLRAVEHADGHGSAVDRANAHLRHCTALLEAGRVAEALAEAEVAERYAREGDDRELVVEAACRQAQLLANDDRMSDALRIIAQARELSVSVRGDVAARAAYLHGKLLTHADAPADAVAAFGAAVELSPPGELRYAAHANRGGALTAAGEPAAAVDDLVEAVAGLVASGAAVPAAHVRFDLAVAYHESGQQLEAAELGEEAVRALDAIGATEPADRCRYLLSHVYRELDEPDQALAQLEELARRLDGFDNLPARGQMLEEAADIRYRRDQDSAAAATFGQAAEAYRAAGLALHETRAVRRQAVSLHWAGEPESALAAVASADSLAAGLLADEPAACYERAMLGYDGTRVLIGADRLDDALARIGPVAAQFRAIEAYGESVQADLLHGEVLLRMERSGEAESLLRTALGAAPRDTDLHRNAAWLLAEALAGQGRHDEAAAVRRENGVAPDTDSDPGYDADRNSGADQDPDPDQP